MLVQTVAAAAGLVAVAEAAVRYDTQKPIKNIELGPRPYYLLNDMDEGWLKTKLMGCMEQENRPTKYSIGHRGGACLQFPEETVESILAGTRMGAGIQECDVGFTKDRQLVCRHDMCDLHTTTNIVNTPLGAKCTKPFQPAANGKPASATCCTSDITLAEFKSLCGKMDGANTSAVTPAAYLKGTPAFRTELYDQCGTVLAHKEYIRLVDDLGLMFTPELKQPPIPMPFQGNYTQDIYAQQMIDEYKQAGIDPRRVWPQSFQYRDILYWLKAEPAFGKQGVLLDESGDTPDTLPGAIKNLTMFRQAGVNIIAPPLPYLVVPSANGSFAPSPYAIEANRLNLTIFSWSLERSGPLREAGASMDYYYMYVANVTKHDGQIFDLLHVLYNQVGVKGLFSDWSATATYFANCFNLF